MVKNQHVVKKTSEDWGVKGEDNTRVTQNFDNQKQAFEKAKDIAINQQSEVFIHCEDGKFR